MLRVVPAVVEIFEAEVEAGVADGATTAVTGDVIATSISETGAMVPTGTSGAVKGNAIGATETAFEADDPRLEEGRHR
ncbi:hypothetical protein PG997_000896 [Apiospora hydei]|uniref:Uncharacterized protein n=1 Tax=Apiospora hydei TaxID=1337664 RepID=A0ABR1XC40_9PEZI